MKLAILGGTGRTGAEVIKLALAQGHEVRALARDVSKIPAGVTALSGNVTDPADVARVAEGTNAVISALGPSKGSSDLCSRAARAAIDAGVKRYISTSGAGVNAPGDQKDFGGRFISAVLHLLQPAVVGDKELELALLERSTVEWTLVRPPRLVDGPPGTVKIALLNAPGTRVSRPELAAFLLRCATEHLHVRQAPFIAS